MTTARERTSHLAALLRSEHRALAEFLVALSAFDAERGWLELGYRSLFEFLLRELGLPKGPAFYRMTAAGLLQRYPELVEPLRDGRLNLSSVTQLAKVITPENRAEVPPRFFRLSGREAKEVVAEIAPAAAPPIRTVVTAVRPEAPRLPAHAAGAEGLLRPARVDPDRGSSEELTQIKSVAPPLPLAPPRPQPTQVEPLTAEKSRLHVTVSRRLLEKLAAARDALSHSHPGASEETILEVGLDLVLERFAKRRGFGAKPHKSAPTKTETPPARLQASAAKSGSAPISARSRYVPAAVRRAVWERDRRCCVWPLESGGVCGSTRQLEFDHVDGWALGAETTVEKLRLLCRFHRDVSARRLYGNELMNIYTKPKGPTCSEPVAEYGAAARRIPALAPLRRASRATRGRFRARRRHGSLPRRCPSAASAAAQPGSTERRSPVDYQPGHHEAGARRLEL